MSLPDPSELQDALRRASGGERRGARRWRRVVLSGLVAMALLGCGLFLRWRSGLCAGSGSRLAEVWNDEERLRVREAFASTGAALAFESFERTAEVLDRYASQWKRAHQGTCEATWLLHAQSVALFDARTACLERRRDELGALVSVLSRADPTLAEHAVGAALSLDPLARCEELALAEAERLPPDSPPHAASARALRLELDEVRAMRRAGRLLEALKALRGLEARALELGHRPLEAELLVELARLEGSLRLPQAEQTARAAVAAAESSRSEELATVAWEMLILEVGEERRRPEEALRLASLAEGALQRLEGEAQLLARFRIERARLAALQAAGAHEAAYEAGSTALRYLMRSSADSRLEERELQRTLGIAAARLARLDEAVKHLRRAHALALELFGLEHPLAASSLRELVAAVAEAKDTGDASDPGPHADAR